MITTRHILPRLFTALCVWVLTLFATPNIAAQEKVLTEKEKIEAVFKHLEGLKDATFIRNDGEHDGKTAALFLRSRWEKHEKEVKNAKEFIEKYASVSSTTSKPYLIRFKDGKETKSGDYLLVQRKIGESRLAEKK